MNRFTISTDGQIMQGSRVIIARPEIASANIIREALQHASDEAYREAVSDVCVRVGEMLDEVPEANREMVVKRSSNHGRRVGP